ncbi:MAG: sugar ABC transporter permease [Caldilineaceae bacterium]|nr:sugar ABC transporter permease [Caldilineaceae bacterium]
MATVAVSRPRRRRHISWMRLQEHIYGWLFIMPVVIGVLLFQFYPILVSIYASMTNWTGLNNPSFIGADNYTRLLTADKFFSITLRNTVYYTLGSIPLSISLAMMLALLCNRSMRMVYWYRTAFFAPNVTSTVAISLVWFWLYAPDVGLFNWLLSLVGVDGPAWLTSLTWAMPAVIVVGVWQSVGYPMLILLAGLQGIPESLYEAAKLDGASALQRFRRVTLPLLTPSIFFLLITQFISSFQVFGLIYVMTQGGPANATNVYIYYLYQNAFAFGRLGYASAMAWVLFLIIAVITLIQWRMQKRWVFYE